MQFALSAGTILIILLIGAITGGEFSIGTVRLIYTRGPTRTQFVLAKVGAAIVCIAFGILAISIIGVLIAQALNPLSSIPQDFDFLTAVSVGHPILHLIIPSLHCFMY